MDQVDLIEYDLGYLLIGRYEIIYLTFILGAWNIARYSASGYFDIQNYPEYN